MPSTINSDNGIVSGTSGLKTSGGNDGITNFQQNGTTQATITAAGLFQFNSGYGSVATAYGCRAWVNFNGAGTLTGTYSQSGTTITVTITSHGLSQGQSVYITFQTGAASAEAFTVTSVTNANVFVVTSATSRTTSGNCTLATVIRASGNVSSITDNGTGDYTVNFTTAMPDANYSVNANNSPNFAGAFSCGAGLFSNGTPTETAPTTSAARVFFGNTAGAAYDPKYVCISIFR